MTVHASSLAWGSLWAQEPGTDHRVVNSQAGLKQQHTHTHTQSFILKLILVILAF